MSPGVPRPNMPIDSYNSTLKVAPYILNILGVATWRVVLALAVLSPAVPKSQVAI